VPLQLVMMIPEGDALPSGRAQFNAPTWRESGIHANQTLHQPKDGDGRTGGIDSGVLFCARVLHGPWRIAADRFPALKDQDVLSGPSLAGLGPENLALKS
jgi:hypothetical protein